MKHHYKDITALAQELRKLAELPFRITYFEGKFMVELYDGPIAKRYGAGVNKLFTVAYQLAVNELARIEKEDK